LATLKKTRNTRVKEYSAVDNTDRAYGGHVERGKKFLAAVVEERMQRGEDVCAEGIVTEELAKAFDKPPNSYSAMAVEMFMVQKCFTEGLGKSTAMPWGSTVALRYTGITCKRCHTRTDK
jgi:hypothetical protein